jgi:acetoin utilization deacetylase AcuC-like enzyme
MSDPALERIRVYFDERLLAYDTGSGFFEHPPHELLCVSEKHPENGDRVRNIHSVCLKGPIGARLRAMLPLRVRLTPRAAAPHLVWHTPLREATVRELSATHDTAYLESLQAASVTGKRFGASTVLPQGGWTCVALAGGAAGQPQVLAQALLQALLELLTQAGGQHPTGRHPTGRAVTTSST